MKRLDIIRAALGVLILAATITAVTITVAYEPTALGTKNVRDPAASTTYISVQGFHFEGNGLDTKPGRLVSVSPYGQTNWVYNGTGDPNWFYDVEPINNSSVFVTISKQDHVEAVMLNTNTRSATWRESFNAQDTHDIDYNRSSSTLLVAPMHKDYYEDGQQVYRDRAFAYNRSTNTVEWSWAFNSTYETPDSPPRTGWTHLNDIDRVDNDTVMLSPRNFNRVIFVNTTSGVVEQTLGKQDNTSILHRQHNPDIVSTDPLTVLVADSENNRVVEYTLRNGTWERTWVLRGNLNWPRDADRLPNGNTLVTDTLNHRVIEVTPNGSVVWEYYAPWAPYDADRAAYGDGSNGPPTHSMEAPPNATVHHDILGGTDTAGSAHVCGKAKSVPNPNSFATQLKAVTTGTPAEALGQAIAQRYSNVAPWVRPRWMGPWALPLFLAAGLLTVVWGVAEGIRYAYKAQS